MQFTIKQADLVRELGYLQQAVQRKPTLPETTRVRIFASDTQRVQFNATDLDNWIETGAAASVQQSGVISIPARLLYQIAKALPHEDVLIRSVRVDTEHGTGPTIGRVAVTAGDFHAELNQWDAANYPVMPRRGMDATPIGPGYLRDMANRCVGSIGREIEATKAALLEFSESETRMLATDGYKMTVVSTPPVGLTSRHRLPEKVLRDLSGLLDGATDAGVAFGDRVISFIADGRSLDVYEGEPKFPAFDRLLALPYEDVASVRRDDLLAAAKRMVSLATPGAGVTLSGAKTDGGLTVTTDEGHVASEPVTPESLGDDFSVRIQGGYLVDALLLADEFVKLAVVRGEGKGVRPLELSSINNGQLYRAIIAQTVKTEPTKKK